MLSSPPSDYAPFVQEWRQTRRRVIYVVAVTGALVFVWTWGYFRAWPLPLGELTPLLWALWLFTLWIAWNIYSDWNLRIVPYFPKGDAHVETEAGWTGKMLYRHLGALDALAVRLDVTPLSEFGFADDFLSQNVTWHNASEGLKTVRALLECGEFAGEFADDLKRVEQALENAQRQNVPFCLIVHGDAVNGMELEQREGQFI